MLTTNKSKFSAKAVDHNNAMIAEIYLQTAFEKTYRLCGIPSFLTALRRIIKASDGLGEFSQKTAISHQDLYTALSENGNPTFFRLVEITRAIGVRLAVEYIACY